MNSKKEMVLDTIFIEGNDKIDEIIEQLLSVRENGGMAELDLEANVNGDDVMTRLVIKNEEPFEV